MLVEMAAYENELLVMVGDMESFDWYCPLNSVEVRRENVATPGLWERKTDDDRAESRFEDLCWEGGQGRQ